MQNQALKGLPYHILEQEWLKCEEKIIEYSEKIEKLDPKKDKTKIKALQGCLNMWDIYYQQVEKEWRR